MSKNTFALVAGTFFLIVALVHALRFALRWDVIVAGWQVPMWVSAVAVVVGAYLAYEGFRKSKSN